MTAQERPAGRFLRSGVAVSPSCPTRFGAVKLLCFSFGLLTLAACDRFSSDRHLADAKEYLAVSDFPSATIELKNALLANSESAEARWLLGKLYLDTGDMASAEKELRGARTWGWQPNDVRPALAKALLAQGKVEEALELAHEDLDHPAAGSLLSSQAMAALADQQPDQALLLIGLATGVSPTDFDVRLAQATIAVKLDQPDGDAQVTRLLEDFPDESGVLWLNSQTLLRQGRLEEAKAALDDYIASSSSTAIADRIMRALVNLGMKDYEAAYADAREVITLSPYNPAANYIVGVYHFQKGQRRAAISALSFAEPVAGQFPLILYYLSSSYLTLQNLEFAEKYANQFLQAKPHDANGAKLLAATKLMQGRPIAAEDALHPILAQAPNDVEALNLMGNALLLTDRADLGMLLYARVAQLDPNWAIISLPPREETEQGVLDYEDNFPQKDILQVLKLIGQEDYDGAIKAAESYRFRDVHSAAPYIVQGRVHFAAGQLEEAQEMFRRVLSDDPGHPSANWNLAELALLAGDTNAARAHYEAVLDSRADDLTTLLKLTELEASAGNTEDMVEQLEEIILLYPKAFEPRLTLAQYYLRKGDYDQVAEVFEDLSSHQRSSQRVMEMLASAQLASGRPDLALSTLETLVMENPGYAQGHYLVARLTQRMGDHELGKLALLTAVRHDPEHVPSLIDLAQIARAERDPARFSAYLETLARLAPDAPEVMRLQALQSLDAGDYETAIEFAQQLLTIAPSTQAVLELASYQKHIGDEQTALLTLQAWLEQHPEDINVRLFFANYLLSAGQASRAEEQYLAVLELAPNNVMALNNAAWLIREDKPRQALSYIETASRLAPNRIEILDSLALIQSLNGQHQDARRNIARALAALPDNPSIRYHAAVIANAAGNREVAMLQLKELLAQVDGFPERDEAETLLATWQE
ncbi:MAG: XrtA/PEP-CTERM system TPR-repeat protein PrsT [Pseudomonadota bacterium]